MKVLVAFAAVYVIWGSTYLAIAFAIETLPPFMMAGVRFLVAGGVLYLWSRARGASRPSLLHWRSALIIGGLLLFIGNGGVVWAEQRVTSGQAALLAGTVPLWMVLLEWVRPGGERPTLATLSGLAVGIAGMVMLVGTGDSAGGGVDLLGTLALLLAALTWAIGSLYARGAPLPSSAAQTTGIQMLAGGALLFVFGLVGGEWGSVEIAAFSARSVLALLYLIVFGSLIGYSAYIYILGNASPTRVSTYAYVNPVVAVFLGWALNGEPLTARTLIAAGVIVGSVVLLTIRPSGRRTPPEAPLRRGDGRAGRGGRRGGGGRGRRRSTVARGERAA